MTFPVIFEPPIEAWVIPSDGNELQPKPALLYKETEHEIVVCEYSDKKKAFSASTRERRAKAYRHFEECRIAMLQRAGVVLEEAKVEARNRAAIYNHILSMAAQAFPHEQAKALREPQPEEKAQEGQEEKVVSEESGKKGKAKPALERPAVRRRS